MSINSIFHILLSFPKTVYFNFRHLPFRQAIKLPIWIRHHSYVNVDGKIKLSVSHESLAMIRLGFHEVPICSSRYSFKLITAKHSILEFKGETHIGYGTSIHVANGASLELGDNFAISANSQINCYKRISIGNDVQLSWDCLVMDSDTHNIYDCEKRICNLANEIILGDKLWCGCKVVILKGTVLPNNCVVGANSLVCGKNFEANTIIVGNPAKSVKKISGWTL